MDFTNKVVIITGASSGIGAGAAIYISKLGASLVLTGRNEVNLKETSKMCKGSPILIVGDVNVEADRVNIINKTIAKFGKLNVLVNNAGMGQGGDIFSTTMEQFDRVMSTNVRSVFHLTQLAVPHLIATQGNIVNVSSVFAGLRSFTGYLSYCMSKAALDQFTKCVALELAPNNVRVNSINPGIIVTNIFQTMGMSEEVQNVFLEKAKETHPLGRVGTVDETAHAIAFLASDHATFITGTNLSVDGGKAALCPQ
ncbi:unnamed protein product [Diamesa serratosioi]